MITLHQHGEGLIEAKIKNEELEVSVFNFGARTGAIRYQNADIALYYPDPKGYLSDPYYMGAMIGRWAGRVKGGVFDWGGEPFQAAQNEGVNTLHSGPMGLSQQFWTLDVAQETALRLTYRSPDGEGGFPGSAFFDLRIALDGAALTYHCVATVEIPTPISLTQHNYYKANMDRGAVEIELGSGNPQKVVLDQAGIPTKEHRPQARKLARREGGYDDLFLIGGDAPITLCAQDAVRPFRARFHSNQEAAVIYDGGKLSSPFSPYSGLCIEPQSPPFSGRATPKTPYIYDLRIAFSRL